MSSSWGIREFFYQLTGQLCPHGNWNTAGARCRFTDTGKSQATFIHTFWRYATVCATAHFCVIYTFANQQCCPVSSLSTDIDTLMGSISDPNSARDLRP
mmetsp:Transcript_65676/g.126687  ORF Transcript_65676/g.126687 Transcript_65676/m.126687 type:complete len:99 (+) Transcript_65676:148-444(+)